MKECSANLAEKLNSDTEFICCNLFTLKLKDGTIYRITDFDKDVNVSGASYKHDLFIIKRDQTKTSGTPSVDSMSVTIYADKDHNDKINNVYIMKAVHDGMLDDAHLLLARCYFDADNESVLGMLNLFQGKCEVSSCTGLSCKLTVKSETVGLSVNIPLRVFAPQNVYQATNGNVTTASTDAYTCMIPLKPSKNVLVKL